MIKLYDMPGNSNSRKIRAVARELDVHLEMVPVDLRKGEGSSPEFLAINPNGKIPALTDGELKLFESNAIMLYLASKHRGTRILPADPEKRAVVDQWLFWQTAHLGAALGKVTFERFYKVQLNLGTPDAGKIAEGLAEFDRYMNVLDAHLAGKDFVCGAFTVADYALCGTLQSRTRAEVDLSKWKNVTRWLGNVESRPAWVQAEA